MEKVSGGETVKGMSSRKKKKKRGENTMGMLKGGLDISAKWRRVAHQKNSGVGRGSGGRGRRREFEAGYVLVPTSRCSVKCHSVCPNWRSHS